MSDPIDARDVARKLAQHEITLTDALNEAYRAGYAARQQEVRGDIAPRPKPTNAADDLPITVREMAAECEREVHTRRVVYSKQVEQRRMNPIRAAWKIKVMKAAAEYLRERADKEQEP